MVRLLSISIDIISVIFVLLPVMILMNIIFFKKQGFKKKTLVILFAIYLSAVFSAVGVPAVNSLRVDLSFQLIPFIDIINSPVQYVKNTILNIILFVPLGFFLPAIWKEYASLKKTGFIGLGLSVIIEILQIFTFRLTDIDDLITNTIGTVLGYCLFKRFSGKLRLRSSAEREDIFAKYEPFIITVIVFLIMFTVQPLISGAIWESMLSSAVWEGIK